MNQNPPFQPPPRNLPRFLPTLTEVVQAPTGGVHSIGASPDPELMVQRILARLDGQLKASVQAAIQDMVREQLQVLEPLLMQEIELAVRQAVFESMSKKAPPEGQMNAL